MHAPFIERRNINLGRTQSKFKELKKPPITNPLRSRWIPGDDLMPRVDTSYKKVPKQFMERHKKK